MYAAHLSFSGVSHVLELLRQEMNYVGKIISNVKGFYSEINAATLTGAIDVIVVEQEDGTFTCSPFHVRFGKMGVLRSKEKVVYIEINGETVDLHMKLGDAGEAFFVREIPVGSDKKQEPEVLLATSPIPAADADFRIKVGLEQMKRDGDDEGKQEEGMMKQQQQIEDSETDDEMIQKDQQPQQRIMKRRRRRRSFRTENPDDIFQMDELDAQRGKPYFHVFSDGDLSPRSASSPVSSRPPSPVKSDTEIDLAKRHNNREGLSDEIHWSWGKLPEKASDSKSSPALMSLAAAAAAAQARKQPVLGSVTKQPPGEIYLDDLNSDALDPEMANLYLSKPDVTVSVKDDDQESGHGPSLPQSPNTTAEAADSVDPSLYGQVGSTSELTPFTGDLSQVAFSLCGGLVDPDSPLPADKFDQNRVSYEDLCLRPDLFGDASLVVRINGKFYSWPVAAPMLVSQSCFGRPLSDQAVDALVHRHMPKAKKKRISWFTWGRGARNDIQQKDVKNLGLTSSSSLKSSVIPESQPAIDKGNESSDTEQEQENDDVCYVKSVRLDSEQLKNLHLQPGRNDISFAVTTAYQGTTRCDACIFLWKYSDRIVVSDIDGTITRSDVLGQVLPLVGKDWSQGGVAQLFSAIAKNGYKFLYLSARAIGQSSITRTYLRSVRQRDFTLPEGPLLMSPSSLISAFHREVIEKKPEEFKISCLRDIQSLFPRNPFHSGFGNKVNDVKSYQSVDILISRIFTINPRGEVRHEVSQAFLTSYSSLSDIADQVFPPVDTLKEAANHGNAAHDYNSFVYWREPLPELVNVSE